MNVIVTLDIMGTDLLVKVTTIFGPFIFRLSFSFSLRNFEALGSELKIEGENDIKGANLEFLY